MSNIVYKNTVLSCDVKSLVVSYFDIFFPYQYCPWTTLTKSQKLYSIPVQYPPAVGKCSLLCLKYCFKRIYGSWWGLSVGISLQTIGSQSYKFQSTSSIPYHAYHNIHSKNFCSTPAGHSVLGDNNGTRGLNKTKQPRNFRWLWKMTILTLLA